MPPNPLHNSISMFMNLGACMGFCIQFLFVSVFFLNFSLIFLYICFHHDTYILCQACHGKQATNQAFVEVVTYALCNQILLLPICHVSLCMVYAPRIPDRVRPVLRARYNYLMK